MKRSFIPGKLCAAVLLWLPAVSVAISTARAADANNPVDLFAGDTRLAANGYFDRPLEELLQLETQTKAFVGSRAGPHNAFDAAVPVDVITAEQLQSVGQVDLPRALSVLLPGFNMPRPSITDATDHAPPFTLRGLSPDQVLVLINGKRLHQGSLLHNNGTVGRGSSSVDLAMIPLAAVERVEVLRDGAAAQYGSDAIAGIINVVLKGYGQANQAYAHYGHTRVGDGLTRQAGVLGALSLPNDGYFNLLAEVRAREATNRAGDAVSHFGDAKAQNQSLMLNAELPQADQSLYLRSLYNRRHGEAAAFFRPPSDARNVPAIYPQGFLPKLAPHINDLFVTAGGRGLLANGVRWDVSYTRGQNRFHYLVRDTLNASLGAVSPTRFDSGTTRYIEDVFNASFGQSWNDMLITLGYEWRQERYQIEAGEPAAYLLAPGSDKAYGAQGFPGFTPENAVSARRRSESLFVDMKHEVSPRFGYDLAARLEDSSDFSAKLNGKLAVRYRPAESWLLRTSLSSGFRAPSLSQANFSYTGSYRNTTDATTSFWGNYAVDHPLAQALGASALQPETSLHYTLGTVWQPVAHLDASVDGFMTEIRNRILTTGFISADSLTALSPQAIAILADNNVEGATYFTNGINTRTLGLDLRLNYRHEFANGGQLKLTGSYQRRRTRISGVNAAPGVLGVSMVDLLLDANTRHVITEGQPRDDFGLWSRYSKGRHALVANLRRYGPYASTNNLQQRVSFAAQWTLDAEWAYAVNPSLTLAIGASNLTSSKPASWGLTTDSVFGQGKTIPYSQYAPLGYNGAYYYLRANLHF